MIVMRPKARLTKGTSRVQPEVLFALNVAENILERFGLSVAVASILDGHSIQHRIGYEADIEVPEGLAKEIAADLQVSLLDSFIVKPEGRIIHMVFTHAS